MPELSSRQLAAWSTDNLAFALIRVHCVSHPVQRRSCEVTRDAAQGRPRVPSQDAAALTRCGLLDASSSKVIGWGYYYLVTVMDDYSRFILAHKLQRDMTTDSLIEVVQEAVDKTGMTERDRRQLVLPVASTVFAGR